MRVKLDIVEPVSSVAVRTTEDCPVSESEGVPWNTVVGRSKSSQEGRAEVVYVILDVDWKVDGSS